MDINDIIIVVAFFLMYLGGYYTGRSRGYDQGYKDSNQFHKDVLKRIDDSGKATGHDSVIYGKGNKVTKDE